MWPAMRASTGPPPAILLPLGHAAGGFSGPPHSPRPRQGPTLHGTATGSPTPPHRVPAVACEPHAPVNDGLVEAFPRGGTSLPGGHMGLLHRGPAGTRTPQPPIPPPAPRHPSHARGWPRVCRRRGCGCCDGASAPSVGGWGGGRQRTRHTRHTAGLQDWGAVDPAKKVSRGGKRHPSGWPIEVIERMPDGHDAGCHAAFSRGVGRGPLSLAEEQG